MTNMRLQYEHDASHIDYPSTSSTFCLLVISSQFRLREKFKIEFYISTCSPFPQFQAPFPYSRPPNFSHYSNSLQLNWRTGYIAIYIAIDSDQTFYPSSAIGGLNFWKNVKTVENWVASQISLSLIYTNAKLCNLLRRIERLYTGRKYEVGWC